VVYIFTMNQITPASTKDDIITAGAECVDYYIHQTTELKRQRTALVVAIIFCFAVIFS
jgi:hypothetical protein